MNALHTHGPSIVIAISIATLLFLSGASMGTDTLIDRIATTVQITSNN